MKIYSVLLIIAFSLTTNIFPQLQFTPHTITTNAIAAEDVYAVDVDGDGDMDVLSASADDNKIAWYENDGNENFASHTITTTADWAVSVFAVDVDDDGDMDVLSASDYGVAWYENDGNENFTTHTITDSANFSESVYAVDVDGDADIDVLSAYFGDDNITWYENDGNENFTPYTITNSVDATSDVYAVDVDGDGDMDVLSASCGEYPSFISKICWYKNDGNENFTQYTITANTYFFLSVHAEDVDGDGDMDVLSASVFDDRIAWYENDGNENFTSHTITTGADAAFSVYAEDVDGDGDMDVLSASFYDHKIAWYENDGNENFTPHTITIDAGGARSVFAIDVDGDGYMDVLSASRYDSTIAWYENLLLPDTLRVPLDYSTIQAAINAANNGDMVLVADGTYYENINFKGKAITVASHFINGEDTSHITNTIINGSLPSHPDTASVVTFDSSEDTTSVLCGFTITGGTGQFNPAMTARGGGGIMVYYSGAKICNNIIENNSVTYTIAYGGGIVVAHSTTIIENNIIKSNTVSGDYPMGGGISVLNCGLTYIHSNKIIDNEAIGNYASGGGIDLNASTDELTINSNYIKGNSTTQTNVYGGGGIDLYNWGAPIIVSNNLIVDNTGYKGGGVLVDYDVEASLKPTTQTKSPEYLEDIPILVNNTIIYNSAEIGGGIHTQVSTPDVMNSIVWGNTAPADPQIAGTVNVVYSDVEGGWAGEGNINANPSFSDTLFHLADSSLCIGAGKDSIDIGGTMYYCPPFCFYGSPRPNPPSSMPDIGACESLHPYPVSVENNLSQIPVEYSLAQNYPNPFNPTTTIKYQISELNFVTIKVYDVLGNEIATLVNEEEPVGSYRVEFDATNSPSGVYFYQLRADSFVETKKMVLLR